MTEYDETDPLADYYDDIFRATTRLYERMEQRRRAADQEYRAEKAQVPAPDQTRTPEDEA